MGEPQSLDLGPLPWPGASAKTFRASPFSRIRARLLAWQQLIHAAVVEGPGCFSPTVSASSVGGAWMVMARSRADADISMASIASAEHLTCFRRPTMPTPSTRSVSGSTMSLVSPSLPAEGRRPVRTPPRGNFPDGDLLALFCFLRFRLRQAAPGDLRIGKHHRRDGSGVENGRLSRQHFGNDSAFIGGLVRQHRLAGNVADGEDVRHARPPLAIHLDEPALVHRDPSLIQGQVPAVGPPPDRHQHAPSKTCSLDLAIRAPPEWARMPSADFFQLRHFRLEQDGFKEFGLRQSLLATGGRGRDRRRATVLRSSRRR